MHNNVYCIIVLYNSMRWIDMCIESLHGSDFPVSIVCVDNCSTDGACEYIRKNYPDVILIQNETNKGFGQANNQGIEYAYAHGATHFFLLNQDAWIYPDTIRILVERQNKYKLGLVSPIHLNGSGTLLDCNFFDSLIIFPKNNLLFHDALKGTMKDYYVPKYTVCAAAWMLSKKCIESIGGFDPIFFHYGEDKNYFQRVLYHKLGVGVVPTCFIHHDREYHGNLGVYNKRRTETKLLDLYADVNDSKRISNKRLKIHIFFLKAMVRFLFSLNFKSAVQILRGYYECARKAKKIRISRQQNAILQPNWLRLQKDGI